MANNDNPNNNRKISKFLSYILRHNPDAIGLKLNAQGWAEVDTLLACAARANTPLSLATLQEVVAHNSKKRFSFNAEGTHIRANQGHSIPIDLQLEPRTPPSILYHGTATRFLAAIQREGLSARTRHHVHLSLDVETASAVGKRHGQLVILQIDAKQMHTDGCQFYCSENGVWLTDAVAPRYFQVLP